MKKNSSGFSFVAILAVIATIAAIVAVSYVVYDKFFKDYLKEDSNSSITTKSLPTAPESIVNQSDIDKAIKTLDEVNLDDSKLNDIQDEIDSF